MKNELTPKELLTAWEETYKKGQLTLWIFLALRKEKMYVDEIKEFLTSKSQGSIVCEEQSLYRALRKFENNHIVKNELRKGNKGPDRKYYYLTDLGKTVFEEFVKRNINIFYTDEINSLLR